MDAADYTLWRDRLGSGAISTAALTASQTQALFLNDSPVRQASRDAAFTRTEPPTAYEDDSLLLLARERAMKIDGGETSITKAVDDAAGDRSLSAEFADAGVLSRAFAQYSMEAPV